MSAGGLTSPTEQRTSENWTAATNLTKMVAVHLWFRKVFSNNNPKRTGDTEKIMIRKQHRDVMENQRDPTVPYRNIPYHTVTYYTIIYHTIPFRNIPYHNLPYHNVPYVPYCNAPYRTIQYHIIQYCTNTLTHLIIPCCNISCHTIT